MVGIDYDSEDDHQDKDKRKSGTGSGSGFGSTGGSSSAFSRFYSGNAGGAGIGAVGGGGAEGGGGGDEGGRSVGRYNPLFHNAVSFFFFRLHSGVVGWGRRWWLSWLTMIILSRCMLAVCSLFSLDGQ